MAKIVMPTDLCSWKTNPFVGLAGRLVATQASGSTARTRRAVNQCRACATAV